MLNSGQLYGFYTANLRAVGTAIDRVGRLCRAAISVRDEKTTRALERLFLLLLAIWAEARLKKLLYERAGFEDVDRQNVLSLDSQLEQWRLSIERAFRKHHGVSHVELSDETLPHGTYARYRTLGELLDQDLRPIIELRNRLAHGQWVYLLNHEQNEIAAGMMATISRENLLSLQLKRHLIGCLCEIVHDLVISATTFARDFDGHYRQITETRRHLRNANYAVYCDRMRAKYERGQQRRKAGHATA